MLFEMYHIVINKKLQYCTIRPYKGENSYHNDRQKDTSYVLDL